VRSTIRHRFFFLVFSAFFCFHPALSDYAWIPDYHHLQTKLGIDYFQSSENFGSDGVRNDLMSSGKLTTLRDYKFWVEGEYGFVKDWSGFIRIPFTTALIDNSTDSLFTGTGFSDADLGLKWNILRKKALVTFELLSRFPLYSTSQPQSGDLVLGDGSVDVSAKVHVGYRFNRQFVAGISPAIMLRSSGYESAFTATAFGGVSFNPVYLRLVAESYVSLGKPVLSTPTTSNSATGSGNSFARLSLNPNTFAVGTRVGIFVDPDYRIEASAMWSTMGSSAPVYFKGGLNLVMDFDLYEPEKPRTKVREIPFETEQQPLDRSKNPEFGAPTINSQEPSN